jgi:alginate O-acetyltransferase complex protein AlgI
MALGLARVFGFHFPENFAGPYRSRTATEFWARWHMTLSRWFRDYVYIPLGGNRHGRTREYSALLATFALTSLWHGASWPFLIWGAMWSGLLLIERITGLRKIEGWIVPRRVFMIFFIIISWVPFNSHSTTEMLDVWQAMFSFTDSGINPIVTAQLTPIAVMAIVVGLTAFLAPQRLGKRTIDALVLRADGSLRRTVSIPIGVLSIFCGVTFALWSSFSPFLYYQF